MIIVCVNDVERGVKCDLTVGKEYEALTLTDSGRKITLKNDVGGVHSYFAYLFEEVDGKYVECVDNNEGSLNLTIGKIYPAIKSNRVSIVRVINDKGLAISYRACRFKEVKVPSNATLENETVDVGRRNLAVALAFSSRVLRDATKLNIDDNTGQVLSLILSELNGGHGVGSDTVGTYLYFLNDNLRYYIANKELTIKDVDGNSAKFSKNNVKVITDRLRSSLIKELDKVRKEEESLEKSLNILNM